MAVLIKCDDCGAEYTEGEEHLHASTPRQNEATGDPTGALTGLKDAIGGLQQAIIKQDEDMERRIGDAVAEATKGEPTTPTKKDTPVERIQVYDRFDQVGWDTVPAGTSDTQENRDNAMRANCEMALMIFGGTRQIQSTPSLDTPEDLLRAWQHHVLEAPGQRIMLSDGKGSPMRAMDTAESGFGLELIGTQYERQLWEAARNNDSIVGAIREIPMTDPVTQVPIDGDLPEMLFVGESTTEGASNYGTSKTGSSRVTLTAKKFTIQQIWSGEMTEDSIIAFIPFLRDKLNMSATLHLGSAYYNGDDTNSGSGNINLDDADPADTKHYLAWDGIRHYWLVTATGQGKDMAAALDAKEINVARGKLNGGDDDVDALIKNINWGQNATDLILVMDWDSYMNLLNQDEVQTIDKYGSQATIVTGELGRFKGIPIVTPAYASKTEADGKASGTEGNNTKGQITLFNPRGFLAGNRRGVQLFFDRIQRTDQFLFELYTRRAFTRFGGNVAAGIYDITL